MNLLAGKVAIITGASKGIGAGIAKAFSTEGASVVVNYISVTPLGRLGEAGDIAAVAVFLASDASSWITGETIRVGGGAR